MDGFWRDVNAFARVHLANHAMGPILNFKLQPAGVEVDRLILDVVILKAERVAGVHVNQLAHIPIGLRPVKLGAPGFLYPNDFVVRSHLTLPPSPGANGPRITIPGFAGFSSETGHPMMSAAAVRFRRPSTV